MFREKDIFPLFITGPKLGVGSDRDTIIKHAANLGFHVFSPDELPGIISKEKYISGVAKYCLKKSFAFEELLNNLAIYNVMLPITDSSIYELGQFNYNKTKYSIFLPEDKRKWISKKEFVMSWYIDHNHSSNYNFYKIKKGTEYPEILFEKEVRRINALLKRITNKRTTIGLRILSNTDTFNRNKYIHITYKDVRKEKKYSRPIIDYISGKSFHSNEITEDIKKATVFVPLKIMYIYLGQLMKGSRIEKFNPKLYNDKLIEIISKEYHVEKDKIFFIYNRDILSLKTIVFGSFLIQKALKFKRETECKSNVYLKSYDIEIASLREKERKATKNIYYRKRALQIYSQNILGDIKRITDKFYLSMLSNKKNEKSDWLYWNENIHGYINGRDWISNVSSHAETLYSPKNKKRMLYKTDIKDFFNSINSNIKDAQTRFNKEVRRNIFDEDILINTAKQGQILSPIISNAYLAKFDDEISDFCSKKNIKYSRYSDDILISSTELTDSAFDWESADLFVENMLSKNKLSKNRKKTKIVNLDKEEIKVTGIVFKKDGLHLPRRFSNKISAWIRDPKKYGLTEKYIQMLVHKFDENGIKHKVISPNYSHKKLTTD